MDFALSRGREVLSMRWNGNERRGVVEKSEVYGETDDLNETPKLPYEDDSFDFVTNAVSVDYLTKPLEVMQEVRRVLKPGEER